MKNIIRGFVLISLLAGLLLMSTTSQGHAQGVASTPTATELYILIQIRLLLMPWDNLILLCVAPIHFQLFAMRRPSGRFKMERCLRW